MKSIWNIGDCWDYVMDVSSIPMSGREKSTTFIQKRAGNRNVQTVITWKIRVAILLRYA